MINNLSFGFEVNGKHSFRDFGLVISSKNIGLPSKKSVTQSIPFANGFFDFSNVLGYSCWDSRSLSYSFDLIADSSRDLEVLKSDIVNWLFNICDADIFDDDVVDFHFKGSLADFSWDDNDFGGSLAVSFICQPFKFANSESVFVCEHGTTNISYDGYPVEVFAKASSNNSFSIAGSAVSVTTSKSSLGFFIDSNGFNVVNNSDDILYIYFTKEVL